MPVTAKLSRRFYEQFGDETTNELVEWLNSVDDKSYERLQELNERNVAQFRAEIRADFAEQDAKFERRFSEQKTEISAVRTELKTDMARLETRLAWQLMGTLATFIGVVATLTAQLWHR